MRRMIIIALSGVAGLALSITGAQASVVVPGKPSVKIPGNNTHRPAFDVRPSNTQANGIKIVYNGNWSGYVATGTKFKYVVGSYSVPSVNCSVTPSSFSYHWVGLDGASDGTVEQDGIGSFCNGSTPITSPGPGCIQTRGSSQALPLTPAIRSPPASTTPAAYTRSNSQTRPPARNSMSPAAGLTTTVPRRPSPRVTPPREKTAPLTSAKSTTTRSR